MFRYFLLIILCCLKLSSSAQVITESKDSMWNKFKKVSFKLDGTPAWYIEPRKAIDGNPWIWRAHFPSWHTQMDSILLERGFHVAYINTNNLFGHPKAMNIWDDFYDYLVDKKKFAPKVALEGVSRGGLYVYGWAKRNPSKVSCIYAEAPVCDFKSWPGGKGKGLGSPKDWNTLLALYGFTEPQALEYKDQPINDLQALVAYKIPLLHVVSLSDEVVPADENTFILINNYTKFGGSAKVIPMANGIRTSGHHFLIDNPESLADFVYKNSVPVSKPLSSQSFIYNYGDVGNAFYRIKKDKKATVAFLGGSITYNKGWRDKICQYLIERYPETKFTFINAGIGSLGSLPHAFRFKTDVLDKGKIDLLFIESAVNDKANGSTEIQQRRALEGIILQAYQANPNISIAMMAFVDQFKIADYNDGKVPLEVRVHEEIAKHYHLPFINLAEEVTKRINNKEFTWKDDFKDLHPSPFGQEVYYQTIKQLLNTESTKVPTKLVAKKLPKEMNLTNYSTGDYVSINKAYNLKETSINNSWKPTDSAKTREGFVNVPVLVLEKPGSSFEFSFTGTVVGIANVSGPDAGQILYSIDGKPQQTVDLYSKNSKSLHLPKYILLGDDLQKGEHKLKVEVAAESNQQSKGNACRIVNFLVNK